MVLTLNVVFLILSFVASNFSLVFSSSVFSRMFSRLIVDVESFTTSREVSKSDLGWCKQTGEYSFFSSNLNLFGLSFSHLNSGGFRFIRGVQKLCFIGLEPSLNFQRDPPGTFKTSSFLKCT